MIHYLKRIHDTFLFMKIHDFSILIFNLAHNKIKNKTFGFYTFNSHTNCELTPLIEPYKITSWELHLLDSLNAESMICVDPYIE